METTVELEQKAGAQISTRAFVQSVLILLSLMIAAGVLTLIVPAGRYVRLEVEGRQVIDPDSFAFVDRPDYPIWRWFTAPLEVLATADGITIIVIIAFLLMVGASFAVLDKSDILQAALARIVEAFGGRKYLLLLAISFFFMAIGAFFGIFEEVAPLVPLMIALSYSLGWDTLVGLGMSILATNMGFSAAVTNPFTIGVAQKLAGLPLFSGAWLRILIFLVIYAIFALFLTGYARRLDQDPLRSPVYKDDEKRRSQYSGFRLSAAGYGGVSLRRSLTWLAVFMALILLALLGGPVVPGLSDVSLPLTGLLFLLAGVGAGWLALGRGRLVWKAALDGAAGIAPAIPLILMASSVKHIVAQGGILDTLLYNASLVFDSSNPFSAALLIYVLALFIEFFIGSGSAKAFLLMPILLPLADLVGVTRQVAVTAYCFGDGFSNLAYPTNPVLLICLGLTVVSYPQWLKWTLKLWLWVMLATAAFLGLAVVIGYGPF